ncbi:hypothetical protein LXM94_06240 [Rhizobium sp. TRM95111]|uniref:hypothetical protein n=1 Tax=Rhizobium alarense TaxID=2846851 RepID=UPI001F1D512D|nr:hypothetical protein [Rhizobium alarense]MCF3639565.1 hypothetical protein [Rhizobium alarense]
MNVQLARYLKDFTPPKPRPSPLFQTAGLHGDLRMGADKAIPMQSPEPAVDIEAERAEAYEAGHQAATDTLAEQHRREIAELSARHRAELDTLREQFERDYAARLAERFSGMVEKVGDLVAEQVAHVIAPVMEEVLAREAVANLAQMIRNGLQAGEGVTVTVRGSDALFEMLRAHFDDVAAFRHQPADDTDLTVEFGETILVTRMAAWADTVRKVLA